MRVELCLPDGTCTPVTRALPGRHNVQNALAAAAVAWQLGIPAEAIASALEKFQGIGRRFNLLAQLTTAQGATVQLVDDYGNHPKRSEEHTSELQSLMRITYAVFCLKKEKMH